MEKGAINPYSSVNIGDTLDIKNTNMSILVHDFPKVKQRIETFGSL